VALYKLGEESRGRLVSWLRNGRRASVAIGNVSGSSSSNTVVENHCKKLVKIEVKRKKVIRKVF